MKSYNLPTFALTSIFLALTTISTETFAKCTDRKVLRLVEQGNTVTSIAKTCRMDKDDVLDIISEYEEEDDQYDEDDSGPGGEQGLRAGTRLGQCGCWGYVQVGYRQPEPRCQSGFAGVASCGYGCPTGGAAWVGVCL